MEIHYLIFSWLRGSGIISLKQGIWEIDGIWLEILKKCHDNFNSYSLYIKEEIKRIMKYLNFKTLTFKRQDEMGQIKTKLLGKRLKLNHISNKIKDQSPKLCKRH
jgi:hypothetical protein